jgi:hypothetical protein
MESLKHTSQDEFEMKNSIGRYMRSIGSSLLAGGLVYQMYEGKQKNEAWLFRDDIGSPHGIKGYEE